MIHQKQYGNKQENYEKKIQKSNKPRTRPTTTGLGLLYGFVTLSFNPYTVPVTYNCSVGVNGSHTHQNIHTEKLEKKTTYKLTFFNTIIKQSEHT